MKSLAVLVVCGLASVAVAANGPTGVASTLGRSVVGQLPPSPVPDQAYTVVPSAPMPGPMVVAPVGLYGNVRVKDQRNIAPCAVPRIVQVADPCNPGCCVNVEICVPPCACECVKTSRCGTKVKYDYGKYEIEITSRRGVIVVDYDD